MLGQEGLRPQNWQNNFPSHSWKLCCHFFPYLPVSLSLSVIVSLMATQLLTIWLKMTGIKCIHFLNAELSYTKHFGELLLQIIYLWKNELPHFMGQQNRHHDHHFSSFFLLTRKNKFFGGLEIELKGTGYSSKAGLACRTDVTFCVLQVNRKKC